MTSPFANGSRNRRKGRVHLSPLASNASVHLSHFKLKDTHRAPSDDSNLMHVSCSVQNVSNTLENGCRGPLKTSYDDRYIPRPIRDLSTAQDTINGLLDEAEAHTRAEMDNLVEGVQEKLEQLRICVSEPDLTDDRILTFSKLAPKAHEAGVHKAVEFVRKVSTKPVWKLKRLVSKIPERVLDAPDLMDDYYLNLLHWGGANCIAVGLDKVVYIWSASTGEIVKIQQPDGYGQSDYVSSVQWSGYSEKSCLAVGYSTGATKLYDTKTQKCLRTFYEAPDRVPSLSWNENILTKGSRSGVITNYDVRVQHALISKLNAAHVQEVCGLAWSHDGRYLASGGNDNQVYVWEKASVVSDTDHLRNFSSHQAAVKAIAWSPRESSVLATGGGTADRCVNFWNVFTGSHLSLVPTNSQVSGIVWSTHTSEFITAHGHPQNHLTLWNYPSMQPAAHLLSHTGRVLCITLSPDGTTVASIGADETLRLWKCIDPPLKRDANTTTSNDLNAKQRWNLH